MNKWNQHIIIGTMLLTWVGQTAAVTDAEKCEATKLKLAGKYNFCRLKAAVKAVKTGFPAYYANCDSSFELKWQAAETNGGGMCPTSGDQSSVELQIAADATLIAQKLAGARYVNNGDGTVTDLLTGLMWEQKSDLGGIHDKDNLYTWSSSGSAPDGTAFTVHLATLNDGQSSTGTDVGGCFAGHCDWRLPTVVELTAILLAPYPCGTSPCIDPIFGAEDGDDCWTATTLSGSPSVAWEVYFGNGDVDPASKMGLAFVVRAVRGGL